MTTTMTKNVAINFLLLAQNDKKVIKNQFALLILKNKCFLLLSLLNLSV